MIIRVIRITIRKMRTSIRHIIAIIRIKLKHIRIIRNSDFKFQSELRPNLNLELLFTEHIEELRQRSFHVLIFLLVLSCVAFLNIKPIVHLLEIPVQNVKFFQLSPGEYFI